MSCPSCKGTRQVVLLYSSVACTDCAELPAAPMLKCTDMLASTGFSVGERVLDLDRMGWRLGGSVMSARVHDGRTWIICKADDPKFTGFFGVGTWCQEPHLLKREKDTI